MAKTPSVKRIAKSKTSNPHTDGADTSADRQSRIDELVKIIDHCTAAQSVAERLGDKFLVYMLSMSVQAARTTMRQEGPIDIAFSDGDTTS